MPTRLAAILALLAFAFCLIVGGLQTGNTFTTTVSRALAAMAGTFVIGLVLGSMAQRMIDENLKPLTKEPVEPEKLKGKTPANGR
jgi:formate hydrogenlyase subunit 4